MIFMIQKIFVFFAVRTKYYWRDCPQWTAYEKIIVRTGHTASLKNDAVCTDLTIIFS